MQIFSSYGVVVFQYQDKKSFQNQHKKIYFELKFHQFWLA